MRLLWHLVVVILVKAVSFRNTRTLAHRLMRTCTETHILIYTYTQASLKNEHSTRASAHSCENMQAMHSPHCINHTVVYMQTHACAHVSACAYTHAQAHTVCTQDTYSSFSYMSSLLFKLDRGAWQRHQDEHREQR